MFIGDFLKAMDFSIKFSRDALEKCPYRQLQQLAKSLKLPSNVKKIHLINLIYTKKFGNSAEVDEIIARVRLERQQNTKIRKGKKKSLQAQEVSSSDQPSPTITDTPKRPSYVIPSSPDYTPSSSFIKYKLRPSQNLKTYLLPKSDRVLRNRALIYKPNRLENACTSLLKAQKLLKNTETTIVNRKVHKMNVCKQVLPVIMNCNVESQQATSLIPQATTPAKRQNKSLSGIYPLVSENEINYQVRSIGLRNKDGRVSKIHAIVEKTFPRPINEKYYKSISLNNIGYSIGNNPTNINYYKKTGNNENYTNCHGNCNYNLENNSAKNNRNQNNGNDYVDNNRSYENNIKNPVEYFYRANQRENIESEGISNDIYIYKNYSNSNSNLQNVYETPAVNNPEYNDNVTIQDVINSNVVQNYRNSSDFNSSGSINSKYPNMSSVPELTPDPFNQNQVYFETPVSENRENDSCWSVYYHKKIRSECVRSRQANRDLHREEEDKLPRINDIFGVRDVHYDMAQPIYDNNAPEGPGARYVTQESRPPFQPILPIQLESIYNYKNMFLPSYCPPLVVVNPSMIPNYSQASTVATSENSVLASLLAQNPPLYHKSKLNKESQKMQNPCVSQSPDLSPNGSSTQSPSVLPINFSVTTQNISPLKEIRSDSQNHDVINSLLSLHLSQNSPNNPVSVANSNTSIYQNIELPVLKSSLLSHKCKRKRNLNAIVQRLNSSDSQSCNNIRNSETIEGVNMSRPSEVSSTDQLLKSCEPISTAAQDLTTSIETSITSTQNLTNTSSNRTISTESPQTLFSSEITITSSSSISSQNTSPTQNDSILTSSSSPLNETQNTYLSQNNSFVTDNSFTTQYPILFSQKSMPNEYMIPKPPVAEHSFVNVQPLVFTPLAPISMSCNTKCVFTVNTIVTASLQTTEHVNHPINHNQRETDIHYDVEDQRDCDFLRIPEPDISLRGYLRCYEDANHSNSSMGSTTDTMPMPDSDMVEDALELISQDGDYMERIGMDVRMQCILCSWAGPKFNLESHIRKSHPNEIQNSGKPEFNVTLTLGNLTQNNVWSCQIIQYDSSLYVLSAKYEDPDCFMASLSTLSDEPPHLGTITVYNKITGQPFVWEGEIQQITPNLPYDNDTHLEVELSKLDLVPNSANLQFINREFVSKSPGKVVVGQPELNDIQITVFAKIVVGVEG